MGILAKLLWIPQSIQIKRGPPLPREPDSVSSLSFILNRKERKGATEKKGTVNLRVLIKGLS